jgi:hypothetical protein
MFDLYESLDGNHENTDIGKFMVDFVKADLDKVTSLVSDTQVKPKGLKVLQQDIETDGYHSFVN